MGACQVTCADEIGLLAQIFGDCLGFRIFSGDGIRTSDRDKQLARVRELLLVKFQPPHGGQIIGKQIQHFDIEAQPRKADGEQQHHGHPPPSPEPGLHGER